MAGTLRPRGGHRYRFRGNWWLDAPPAAVYAVLARAEDYPQWWPQFRELTVTGPDSVRCRFRSVLPADLSVAARAACCDPESGLLEAVLTGDLRGWARWTLIPYGAGTRARYEQDTELCKPALRRLPAAGRPVLRANHALMMRAGRRGLRTWLATHLDDG